MIPHPIVFEAVVVLNESFTEYLTDAYMFRAYPADAVTYATYKEHPWDFFALRAISRAYFKTFSPAPQRAFLRAQTKGLQAQIRELKGVPTCPG